MSQSDPERVASPAPLIVSLAMESRAQEHFEALRRQHFPPERNLIPAHLTLFHALPGNEAAAILQSLRDLSPQPPIRLEVTSLMLLGRGVAFRIESTALRSVHATLRQQWLPWLTAQDRQGFRPHIVIQNKVDPAAARSLHAKLSSSFKAFECMATGLTLWRYLGGPWEHVRTIHFGDMDAATP